jgi:hypothetical protein
MFFLVLFVFKENGAQITGDGLHEVRIIGCITAVLLVGIVYGILFVCKHFPVLSPFMTYHRVCN